MIECFCKVLHLIQHSMAIPHAILEDASQFWQKWSLRFSPCSPFTEFVSKMKEQNAEFLLGNVMKLFKTLGKN